jgi:selenium-binding protein 1
LDTSKIFIFDVHTDPAAPKLHRTIDDFVEKTGGVVGPHTNYALPGRMLITGLSNNRDHGGRTGMAEYTNGGDFITSVWMPTMTTCKVPRSLETSPTAMDTTRAPCHDAMCW